MNFSFNPSECSDPIHEKNRQICRKNVENVLTRCLSETEIEALERIEEVFTKLHEKVCANVDGEIVNREYRGGSCLSVM
jgi:hypothetical protein